MYILMPKIYNFGRFPNHIWSPCLKGYYLDKPGLCVQVVFALFVGYFDNVWVAEHPWKQKNMSNEQQKQWILIFNHKFVFCYSLSYMQYFCLNVGLEQPAPFPEASF
jgi:hypothetical protein